MEKCYDNYSLRVKENKCDKCEIVKKCNIGTTRHFDAIFQFKL